MRPRPAVVDAAAGLGIGYALAKSAGAAAGAPPTGPAPLGVGPAVEALPGGGAVAVGLLALALLVLAARLRGRAPPLRTASLAAFLGLVVALRSEAGPAAAEALLPRFDGPPPRVEVLGSVGAVEPPVAGARAFEVRPDPASATSASPGPLVPSGLSLVVTVAAAPGLSAPTVRPGDRVRVTGRLEPLPGATNPGAYDRRAASARRGVGARLRVPTPQGVHVLRPDDGPLAALAAFRDRAAAALDAAFGAEDAGLLRSLVLGDRGALSPADRRRFKTAGAAHILAISGSHVALLVAGLHVALRRARVPRRVAAGLLLLFVLAFVPFTGGSPPVIRSAAGFSLAVLARLCAREPAGGALLAVVAASYLVLDPGAAEDPGFRMSFAAAAGLVLLAGRLRAAWVPPPPLLLASGPPRAAPVRSALAAGTAAWLASTPVAVLDLHQTCLGAVPVGLLAVPGSTFALLVGAAAAACAPVPVLGPALRTLTEGVLYLLRAALDLPAGTVLATTHVPDPGPVWYLAYLAAFLAAARGGTRAALCGGLVLAVLVVHSGGAGARPPPRVRLTLLDVGHGQAALLETPDGRRALLDAGSRDRPEPAERIVLPALAALGVVHLDLAVASHADADHAGALPEVVAQIATDVVAVPPRFPAPLLARLASEGPTPLEARDGDVLLAGAWGRLRVLGPPASPPDGRSRNDRCLVLLLETPHGVVLLPGDREETGVADLLDAHPDLAADVIVLPHHGLPGPGLARLLAATRPALLLASAPRPSALRCPPRTRATGLEGALVVRLDPAGPRTEAPYADAAGAVPSPSAVLDSPPISMRDPLSLLLAAAALAAIVAASVRLRWLTPAASLAAGVLGFAAVVAFDWAGLAALLAPFLAATLAGKLPRPTAPGLAPDEGPRTLRQVAANGLPALGGIAVALAGAPRLGTFAFVGALATLGADTLATEFGTRYGGTPRHALALRRLARGESGGVTVAGLLASVGGAVLAPAAFAACGATTASAIPPLAVAGVAAAYLDSALGATLQRKGRCGVCGATAEGRLCHGVPPTSLPGRSGLLDNDGVNLWTGVAGGVLAAVLA